MIPLIGSEFMLQAVLIPFLVFSLAAIALNILTGYTGLISLGTGAFMGVGAYACYKLTTLFPQVNIIIWVLRLGLLLGCGRRAVRPAVAAHQGLLSRGRDARGAVLPLVVLHPRAVALQQQRLGCDRGADAHDVRHSDHRRDRDAARCAISSCSTIVVAMTWVASNLVHGRIGRMWMAVRDMDLAAELIGIRLLPTKLLAFAVSSFYCGVAGAMMVFFWYGGAEAAVFDVNQSFFILFMVIVGGLGSLTGSFFGAALIFILPIALRVLSPALGLPLQAATVENLQFMIVGALIIFFLIVEPHGLARLWQIGKQKLRVWPFPVLNVQN